MDPITYRQDRKSPYSGRRWTARVFSLVVLVSLVILATFVAPCRSETETADSPSNRQSWFRTDTLLDQFVLSGGPIVWYILFPMSLWTGVRGIELSILIRRKRLLPPNAGGEIISLAAKLDPTVLKARLANARDLVGRSVHRALVQARLSTSYHRQLEHIAAEALHEQAMGLLRKAELCNLFGNVAPMVGLFGTVVGMIQAFNHLGISQGQPRPDQLATHISVALVTTFWGLLIAIPALSIHGFFRTRLEAIVSDAAREIETALREIRSPLLSGSAHSTSSASSAGSPRERSRT